MINEQKTIEALRHLSNALKEISSQIEVMNNYTAHNYRMAQKHLEDFDKAVDGLLLSAETQTTVKKPEA